MYKVPSSTILQLKMTESAAPRPVLAPNLLGERTYRYEDGKSIFDRCSIFVTISAVAQKIRRLQLEIY